MLIGNLYGRIGQDPVSRTTKAGNPMATASVAVDVAGKDAEPTTLWVSVLAFGTAAEGLLRASKGQMVAALGKLTRGSYTTQAGEVREQWTLLADTVVTAVSGKPSGKARAQSAPPERSHGASMRAQAPVPFDDEIPF